MFLTIFLPAVERSYCIYSGKILRMMEFVPLVY